MATPQSAPQPTTPDGNPGSVLMIKDFKTDLERLWTDDHWTREKLYSLVWSSFPPESVSASIEAIDQELERTGGLNSIPFRMAFQKRIALNLSLTMQTLDNFTRVGAMGVYSDMNSVAEDFKLFSDEFYIGSVSSPGTFGYITGPIYHGKEAGKSGTALGVGKTDTTMLLGEMYCRSDIQVATNVELKADYPGIIEVRSMRELLTRGLEHFIKTGKPTVAQMDEFTQHISKEHAGKREWVDLKKWMYLFRKMGIIFLVISQRGIEIPNAIAGMATLHVQKLNKYTMNVERFGRDYLIRGVPGTKVPFETFASGSFKLDDVNINEMHDMISGLPKGKSQLEAILDFLRSSVQITTEAEKHSAVKVLRMRRQNDLSYQEIGDLVGYSKQRVGQIVNELGLA